MADHYEVLQVHPKAEPDVIRAAFRILARKYHPDFGGDQRQMMALNEAWNVLGDRKRRAAYDAAAGTRVAESSSRGGRTAPRAQATETGPPPSGPLAAAAERRATARGSTPPARQTGTVLDFGRYTGWSVAAIAQHDPDYLLWLERTPVGRPLREEIHVHLERRPEAATATVDRPRKSLLRRRR
jgi:curved DNA-binding protein CbpA